MRAPSHGLGQTRRRAEQIGEKCQQAIVIDQDHHQLDRRRHLAEGVVEPRQRAIGIRGAAERGEQGRCEFGEDFACAGAGDGRAAPEMPAAHRLCRALGIAKAEPLQCGDRLRIDFGAGEDQAACLRGEFGAFLEEQRKVLLANVTGPIGSVMCFGEGPFSVFENRPELREIDPDAFSSAGRALGPANSATIWMRCSIGCARGSGRRSPISLRASSLIQLSVCSRG